MLTELNGGFKELKNLLCFSFFNLLGKQKLLSSTR